MATFRVGQRVKFVHAITHTFRDLVGKTAIVLGTTDRGLNPDTGLVERADYLIQFDHPLSKKFAAETFQLEPLADSGRTVVEFEVGVSPWVPEHMREKREQPATEEPGLTK